MPIITESVTKMQHNTELFSLESSRNGLTYTLIHLPTGKSLFFQGDNALQFSLEYDDLLVAGYSDNGALEEVFFRYNIIPLPFELTP